MAKQTCRQHAEVAPPVRYQFFFSRNFVAQAQRALYREDRNGRGRLEPAGKTGKGSWNGSSGKANVLRPGELREHFLKSGDIFSRLIANYFKLLLCALNGLLRRYSV